MADKKEKKEEKKPEPKKFCQCCKQYSRRTKMCNGLKYVPRKGTCQSFVQGG